MTTVETMIAMSTNGDRPGSDPPTPPRVTDAHLVAFAEIIRAHEVGEAEHFAAIVRDVDACRIAATRAEAATLAIAPVLGRVDEELENTIAAVDAFKRAAEHQAQAIVDLKHGQEALASSHEAIVAEIRGGFDGMKAAYEGLRGRVEATDSRTDAAGRALDSMRPKVDLATHAESSARARLDTLGEQAIGAALQTQLVRSHANLARWKAVTAAFGVVATLLAAYLAWKG